MPVPLDDLARFTRLAFGSVWSLELLLILKEAPERWWRRDELIALLRASDGVLTVSTADLSRAQLIMVNAEGAARYTPAAPVLEETVAAVAALYRSRPKLVRRWIAGGEPDAVERFADAFRFRRGGEDDDGA